MGLKMILLQILLIQMRNWKSTFLICFIALGAAGCSTIPVYEQGFVSQEGMTFYDNPTGNDRVNLLTQLEPGSAYNGYNYY